MATWIEDPGALADYWPMAESEADGYPLLLLLTAARQQCEAFAPELAPGADVPESWRLAQAMQARALWRSQTVGSGNSYGSELTVTVFPMDWTVKLLLRPPGRPRVG